MSNLIIGIVCMAVACFLFFLSPKEDKNMFGYKSPQQGLNKNVWKWSNKCYGLFAIVGSAIYLISAIVLLALRITQYNALLNKMGLAYIFVSIILTEICTYILSLRKQ